MNRKQRLDVSRTTIRALSAADLSDVGAGTGTTRQSNPRTECGGGTTIGNTCKPEGAPPVPQ